MTDHSRLPWRVGRKLGRTVYAQVRGGSSDDDVLLGMMDTAELAEMVCTDHNARLHEHPHHEHPHDPRYTWDTVPLGHEITGRGVIIGKWRTGDGLGWYVRVGLQSAVLTVADGSRQVP